jgi:hypothetical protein
MNGTVASHLDAAGHGQARRSRTGPAPQDARCQTDDFQQYARRHCKDRLGWRLMSRIADSVPGFSHELLPGVAGILTIPAIWGLAGRFARRLAPNGRPVSQARGLRAESQRGRRPCIARGHC